MKRPRHARPHKAEEATIDIIPLQAVGDPIRGAWTGRQINWPAGIDLIRNTYGKAAWADEIKPPAYGRDSMYDPYTGQTHDLSTVHDEDRDNLVGCILERSGRRLIDVDRRFAEYLAGKKR